MKRNILFLALLFSLFSLPSRATDGNKATHPTPIVKITPCAPGVVYLKMKIGRQIQGTTGSGSETIQSVGVSSRFSKAMSFLGVNTVVPFDDHASKDSVSHAFGIDRMMCLYYSNAKVDPHAALAMFMKTGDVECGSPRYLFPVSYVPDDPYISSDYALTNMNVFSAWDMTTGDTSVVIADVDCAINIDHEDLKNQIKYNWGEIGTDAQGKDEKSNGKDDDRDGQIDNWEGWDLCGNVSVGSGAQLQPNNDPRPRQAAASHGTHTAGCILAQGDNGLGIAGVAYGCKLLPIKAAGSDNDNIGAGYEGIHYASTHGAKITNCSWGGFITSADTQYSNAFLWEAVARNVLIVAAAGNNGTTNDGTFEYPADGPNVLSVGATDANDAPANFSDFGHAVSVWAPGVNILSCDYSGAGTNNAYSEEDGTSFSSPLTAGAAGILASMYPTWPVQFISRQLIQTADNVVNANDRNEYWGRINLGNAVSQPSWPGLIITKYSVNNVASGSLGAPAIQQDLNVTFQNVVGDGSNITATLLPGIGYSVNSPKVTFGTMVALATASGDFQITRSGVYSEGILPVRFAIAYSNNLSDTLTLSIPISKVLGFVQDIQGTNGTGVKRVSNTVAWSCNGVENTQQSYVIAEYAQQTGGEWLDTTTLSDGSAAPYDLDALDDNNAFFGTGPSDGSASVIYTNDGGNSFSSADVSTFTPFVNSVHFFDAQNGVIVGDPKSSHWGIGVTADGGGSWNPLTKPVAAAGSVASWNNATSWVGNSGWFGTNNKQILHSTDRGQSWVAVKTTLQHCLGIGFDDDGQHGIACFRPAAASGSTTTTGTNGILVTSNAGGTWTALSTLPATGISPSSVQFIPHSNTAILTSNMGVFRTTDFGVTWAPIGIPTSFIPDGSELSISRDSQKFVVSINVPSQGIASYSEAMAPDSVADTASHAGVSEPSASPLSLEIYPNPSRSQAIITFNLATNEHVSLVLHDALGRNVMTVTDAELSAGQHQARLDGSNLQPGAYYVDLVTASGIHATHAFTILP